MSTSCKWWRAGLGVGLVSSFWAASVGAATFSANPTSDAFVTTGPSGNLSGNNYGGAGGLAVSAAGLPKREFQSVLQFDLSGMRSAFDSQYGASQWSIQAVSLQLTATAANNAIFNATSAGQFQIQWMQNDSWIEGTGTPNAPALTGITFASLQNSFTSPADESLGTFSFNGATTGAANYSLKLTPGFASDLLTGGATSLRLVPADNSISYLFDSRTFATVGSRPVLTIDAVPEPGPVVLWSLAVACLGVVLRRKV